MLVVVAAAPEYAAGNAPDPVGQGRRQKPAVCVKAGIDIIMRSDVVVGQRLQIAVWRGNGCRDRKCLPGPSDPFRESLRLVFPRAAATNANGRLSRSRDGKHGDCPVAL